MFLVANHVLFCPPMNTVRANGLPKNTPFRSDVLDFSRFIVCRIDILRFLGQGRDRFTYIFNALDSFHAGVWQIIRSILCAQSAHSK